MTDFNPGQLKESINKEFFSIFPIKMLREDRFIPITNSNDTLFVGIVDYNDKEKRNSILKRILIKTKLKPKIVALSLLQFNEAHGILYCKFLPYYTRYK